MTVVARLVAAALLAAPLALSGAARAQVVVIANGSPITQLDIEQRTKLLASMTHKAPSRQEVINELIDDRIKIAKAKSYGLEVSDAEVNSAFETMARRQGIAPAQFAQVLDHAGITANAIKARIKAELTWQQLVRGKFNSTLQVGDSDIALALRSRSEDNKDDVGYVYTLYPVMIIVPSGSSETVIETKRREADNLRGRFLSCNEGLTIARALRDVAVREPITRGSADLSPQLRELLGGMEVGRLTTPDVTPQGLQMFALCDKKQSVSDSPAKREVREQIFSKRFETESKKYLEELRKQAMIEYK
ncbi:MAG TPA: SurA N-terminal domain-containing protein [Pseudolabrys sp.]|nr:SurA N-terminal domain-containing protein [Pseudolabrys sp.]